ncbi:hypothetical protein ABEB36_000662 [Hypothenemus hampei]|uniref:Uncharacterized protein n=1 Tax=Hypothenemus hampei TaxID=57062 RepID=A0ABD1FC05_HYPHA
MFSSTFLIATCTFVALCGAVPTPEYYHHSLPVATSYSSRVDIHGPEYIKTYPVIAKTVLTSVPLVKSHQVISPELSYYPSISNGYGYGYGYGHYPYHYL